MAVALDDNAIQGIGLNVLGTEYAMPNDENDRWDAVVIGAGPAGAIAARQLALQHKRVLLIDKARWPRDKVCGGCLGGAALALLDHIGLGHVPNACRGLSLRTFELSSGGITARIPIGRRIAISRREFDDALVREAQRVGVVVRYQTQGIVHPDIFESFRRVTLRQVENEESVLASVVVVATGLAAVPPRCGTQTASDSFVGLGALSAHRPDNIVPGSLYMACGTAGYVGVTAVKRGRFDIAAAVDPNAVAAAGSPGQIIREILHASGSTLAFDWQSLDWQGTPRLTRRATPIALHRLLLIGDAAAYVEPFTGEGIGWAMQSGALAASVLAGPHRQWESAIEGRWQQLFDKMIGDRHSLCHAISRCMRVRPFRHLAAWGLSKAPFLGGPVVRILDRPICTN